MIVHVKPWREIFAKDFNKGFIPSWVNCTYREKQNSSCFLKHSLMSSVDTVELPSPERDHIHHQLPLSRQQDQARTPLTAEWIPLGRTKRKSSSEMLKDPQTTPSQNDSDPTLHLFGHTGASWIHTDMSKFQFGHSTLRAALGGVTDNDSSIWTSTLTRHFIDLVSQIFSRQDNSICWCLINSCAIPCGFTGWGIHHFILLAAVLWDL